MVTIAFGKVLNRHLIIYCTKCLNFVDKYLTSVHLVSSCWDVDPLGPVVIQGQVLMWAELVELGADLAQPGLSNGAGHAVNNTLKIMLILYWGEGGGGEGNQHYIFQYNI